MSGDADKQLMEAVLRQIDGNIDYQRLANDLGMSTAKVAYQRWSRFKKAKLGQTQPPTAARGTKEVAATPSKSPKTTPQGKVDKRRSKKRKIPVDDDEDEEIVIKGEGVGKVLAPETPCRRPPSRKGRFTSFKEEPSDVDDEEEFEDSGHGSGQGGIAETDELGGDFYEDEV